MNRKKTLFFLALISVFCGTVIAQEDLELEIEIEEEVEAAEGNHSLALMMSHTHIPELIDEDGNKVFTSVPSFALDYNYWITEKFAIGFHTDILVEDFFDRV